MDCSSQVEKKCSDSKVHGANMGLIWGQQDPGGPHDGPMKFAIWVAILITSGKKKPLIFVVNNIQHLVERYESEIGSRLKVRTNNVSLFSTFHVAYIFTTF